MTSRQIEMFGSPPPAAAPAPAPTSAPAAPPEAPGVHEAADALVCGRGVGVSEAIDALLSRGLWKPTEIVAAVMASSRRGARAWGRR